MKKLFLVLFGLAVMGSATAQQQGNHWTPVGLEMNMTVNGIILIDGEEQAVTTLEVGAFCGDECRGSRRGAYFGMTGQYVVPLQIQGNTNGEAITFRLYDHATQQELDLVSINTLEFDNNGRLGTPGNWYLFAFMTPVVPVSGFRFTTAGNWSDASNWVGGALPSAEDEAFIEAPCQLNQNAEVAALTIVEGQTLTVQSGKALTVSGTLTNTQPSGLVIENGAQLLHASENVSATVKKAIVGYSYGKGNYYLITNPLTTAVNPETASVNHLTSGNYDLYGWLVNTQEELEWRNYKKNTFMLLPNGKGYLYANQRNVELSFPGILRPSLPYYTQPVSVAEDDSCHFRGWNLIGNPFACNAYLVDEEGEALPYYRMNAAGKGFEVVASGIISPMQGVFYEASENGYVYFTRTASAKKEGLFELSVNQDGDAIDNVIIRFGEGRSLKKLVFNEEESQLFIQQDGKNYAVVSACRDVASNVSTMEVNFKAVENGTYTLSFSVENVEFSYLHFVDTLTGEDIDLLALRSFEEPQGPISYTFEAKTTDNANRFKLVFEVK